MKVIYHCSNLYYVALKSEMHVFYARLDLLFLQMCGTV